MTSMPLSYLKSILNDIKPSDDEEIVITTDGNDIVVEEPKKETKAKPKKAKNRGGNKNESK